MILRNIITDLLSMTPDCSDEDLISKLRIVTENNQTYKKEIYELKNINNMEDYIFVSEHNKAAEVWQSQIAKLQDKLSRRNMQIKDLKERIDFQEKFKPNLINLLEDIKSKGEKLGEAEKEIIDEINNP